ncbi:MAG: ImmA/IrrE family metallo-endopeptidase [Methanobrevibacter sp.]|jgi:Zn-dependent peptidase ImmA (M78 family)|nr:ImmA/IrrE family metallo-endopeptidase [Candidatus Methanoflexus mossambicus]
MVYKVKINPKMIRWAREDLGLSFHDLPKSLKNAEKWEKGEILPTWNDLRNLSKKYKRPPVFYLMSEPPKEVENEIIEFRSPEKIEEYSTDLRLEIRKAKYRRNVFINLNAERGNNIPDFSKTVLSNFTSSDDYLNLAKAIRSFINVSLDNQEHWIKNDDDKVKYDHSIFLYNWKEIFSNLGILVFESENVSENEMSGVSLYYDKCPIIILNGKNTPNRRIFTLFHELAHLSRKETAICDVDKYNKKEAFCNKVASEVLVPRETLTDDKVFFKNGNINYSGLSNSYGVSQQVIIYKLSDLGKITQSEKEHAINLIENKNKNKKQKQMERNKKSTGGGMSKILKKKKYDGKPYSRFILNAYENNIISSSKFMRYLDIPVDKIDSLEEELFK